ncbi:: Phage_AlpA [Gemmata massiliana]|uniref:: Phage_AlpA n=1 Tax=Gemmata massiliana TaxID=1210884 RepID=A0A6P2D7P2_9BACT|nr:AlpA family phage regulatory protein [Gemmata massiliana]VTR97003.1 : Phage_AlpA [Gemmata massiliana]
MNEHITPPARPRRGLRPGLLRRAGAAQFCGVGASTWDRLCAAGSTPAPIRLGGSVAWSRRELARWIDHGCPARTEWEPIWGALRRAS